MFLDWKDKRPLTMTWKASFAALFLTVAPFQFQFVYAQLFVPDLPAGSTYHLAFLTDGTTNGIQEFNEDYDAFVTSEIASDPLLSELEWKTLTTTIHRDAATHLVLRGPIYRLDGVLIADDERDLFDGTIDAPLNRTPSGATKNIKVWTGSGSNGRSIGCRSPGQASWECALGSPDPDSDIWAGDSSATNGAWISSGEERWTREFGLYAFSEELTVPDPPTVPGDFNEDGVINVADIDLLAEAIRGGSTDPKFDLNSSGAADMGDADILIIDLLNTYYGDANLDGEFNSADFVFTFIFGEYEDDIDGNSTWGEGDWNMDGDFNTSDLVFTFSKGGFEEGPRSAVSAVPEPASCVSFLCGIVSLLGFRTLRRRS
jgi:hypothetical protein